MITRTIGFILSKDWDNYLPHFQKLASKKKKTKREFRNKNILPDYPQETEIDRQIESGEYFIKNKNNDKKKRRKQREKMVVEDNEDTAQTIEEVPVVTSTSAHEQRSQVGTAEELAAKIKSRTTK